MTARTFAVRAAAFAAVMVAILAASYLVVRPWCLAWGTKEDEARRSLPGESLVYDAGSQETHAITIHAPLDAVWPWLAQLGQDRGGFYSFDLLENAVGCEMPTEDRLRPDRQAWQVGDRLWMYPEDRAGGIGFATLRVLVPGRALAFATRAPGTRLTEPENGSWAFVLEPIDAETTRLIVRGRVIAGRSAVARAFDASLFGPMHFVMERRMMTGIKELAEGSDRGRLTNHVAVALWIVAAGQIITAAILVFRRPRWTRPLAGLAASALTFELLTLVQPPLLAGCACVAGVGVILARRA
ncbi:MAG TPA: hypothetical protein VLT86_11140 [Vicinamibacterales bacterium]|nr:hypothetical protein [Vicinamibacterales bacterium]